MPSFVFARHGAFVRREKKDPPWKARVGHPPSNFFLAWGRAFAVGVSRQEPRSHLDYLFCVLLRFSLRRDCHFALMRKPMDRILPTKVRVALRELLWGRGGRRLPIR